MRAVEETLPLDALCCAQALTLSERSQLSRAESLKLSRKQPIFRAAKQTTASRYWHMRHTATRREDKQQSKPNVI